MNKEPISVAPDIWLSDAVDVMRSWGMRHLPVTEKDGSVIGLLSERDIWRHMALNAKAKSTVREVMVSKPYVVQPEDLLSNVTEVMAKNKYGCAIVVNDQGICGIFTSTDALKMLAELLRHPDMQGRQPTVGMCKKQA